VSGCSECKCGGQRGQRWYGLGERALTVPIVKRRYRARERPCEGDALVVRRKSRCGGSWVSG
jgi:hypothetical protein